MLPCHNAWAKSWNALAVPDINPLGFWIMQLSWGKHGVAMFGETYGASDNDTLPIGKEVFQFLKSKNGCLGGASAE